MYTGDKTKFGDENLAAMKQRAQERTYIKTPDEVKDNLNTGDNLEGSILYKTYCANCHQRNGKGDNNLVPPLDSSEYVMGDKDRLINIILNGLTGEIKVKGKTYNGLMPAHANILDDHAIASITTFIRNRFGKQKGTVTTHDVIAVRKKTAKK
jgi:mono/diheme cytochrome c family protein